MVIKRNKRKKRGKGAPAVKRRWGEERWGYAGGKIKGGSASNPEVFFPKRTPGAGKHLHGGGKKKTAVLKRRELVVSKKNKKGRIRKREIIDVPILSERRKGGRTFYCKGGKKP